MYINLNQIPKFITDVEDFNVGTYGCTKEKKKGRFIGTCFELWEYELFL